MAHLPFPPLEPEPADIAFPPEIDEYGVVAVGSDFRPSTLVEAYRNGVFPWPHRRGRGYQVLWCSPDPRAVFPLEAPLHISRSMRRVLRQGTFAVTQNAAFANVVRLCGETRAEGTWIIPPLMAGYQDLHHRGFCHSIEVWRGTTLVGGIYGVAMGRVFSGESMFHLETDASKVAFLSLASSLHASGFEVFDVQVQNPHLASLGCVEVSRESYLRRMVHAHVGAPAQLRLSVPFAGNKVL